MISRTRGIGMTSQRTRDRMVARLREKGIVDEVVLAAMSAVPRHLFVEEALASRAYEDTALPIGFEQTISQPFVVALMIEAVRDGRVLGRVLEVGTGCGYQAAVLSEIASQVHTIEIVTQLADEAAARLRRLGYANVHVRAGDGYLGWPEQAPFDAIMVTAAAPRIPEPLKQQLRDGGRLIVPVGEDWQELVLVTRRGNRFEERRVLPVRFVPMTGKVRE
jgi:protein-L-isoaspartate(D-aspartate) O-methyltransferase